MVEYEKEAGFTGTIIEESLESKDILKTLKILSTKISTVTDRHKTPWVKQWVLHKVEISSKDAKRIAVELSKIIDVSHVSSWYADFKSESQHFIIFRDKVFIIDRISKEQYEEATKYGLELGIPDYQLDFMKDVVN